MQKGPRGSQRRVTPKRRSGIADESAPYWQGERAEAIVAARKTQYDTDAEAKRNARRGRRAQPTVVPIDAPSGPVVGLHVRSATGCIFEISRVTRYKSGRRWVALRNLQSDGYSHFNRAALINGVWCDDAGRPIEFVEVRAATPAKREPRASRGEKTPNQRLRRLERALARRKTLAARQRVQQQIDDLRRQLGLA